MYYQGLGSSYSEESFLEVEESSVESSCFCCSVSEETQETISIVIDVAKALFIAINWLVCSAAFTFACTLIHPAVAVCCAAFMIARPISIICFYIYENTSAQRLSSE